MGGGRGRKWCGRYGREEKSGAWAKEEGRKVKVVDEGTRNEERKEVVYEGTREKGVWWINKGVQWWMREGERDEVQEWCSMWQGESCHQQHLLMGWSRRWQ